MSRFQHLLIGNIPNTTFLYAPGSGMASFYAFVMAGVRHEPTGANGIAHLCEHLLFGGTERRWQKELFSAISQIGAFFNADTQRDYTCFNFVVPSS